MLIAYAVLMYLFFFLPNWTLVFTLMSGQLILAYNIIKLRTDRPIPYKLGQNIHTYDTTVLQYVRIFGSILCFEKQTMMLLHWDSTAGT